MSGSMDGNKWSEEEVTKLLATRKELDISQFLWGRGMPNDPEFIEVLARVRAKEPVENEARPAECLQEMGVAGTDRLAAAWKGCAVRHGAIRLATTINEQTAEAEYVDVKEDSGSDVNWISRETAYRLEVMIETVDSAKSYQCFMGQSYVPRGKAKVSLTGSNVKSVRPEFFVAPEGFPFPGIVVGRPFIEEWGHPHNLFPEKPEPGESLLMTQTKLTNSERESLERRRAENERRAAEVDNQRQQRSPRTGQRSADASSASASGNQGEKK